MIMAFAGRFTTKGEALACWEVPHEAIRSGRWHCPLLMTAQ